MNEKRLPILSSERLILRCISENDADVLTVLRSDKNVNKHLHRPKNTTFEATQQFIQKILRGYQENGSCYWIITEKGDNKLIGTICLWNFSADRKTAEIGFELLPHFQGKGIMQEAVLKVIQFGFEDLELTQIGAFTKKNNQKSIELLEKVGFFEDTSWENTEGEYLEDYLYFSLKP
jgi:[ribosomal protein S5]-alanine N-acetyltransferase